MAPEKMDLSRVGSRSPCAFAKKLNDSTLVDTDSYQTIDVSLTGLRHSDYINLEDLAVVATLVRLRATEGRAINLHWPRRTKSGSNRLPNLLGAMGFAELFSPRLVEENWVESVRVIGRTEDDAVPGKNMSFARFVTARWIDCDSFEFNRSKDLLLVQPRVRTEVEVELRGILRKQGFLETEAVDRFIQVILNEVGWNTVIHSTRPRGKGVALLCAQVVGDNVTGDAVLRFCLVDVGLGIPHTLADEYGQLPEDRKHVLSDQVNLESAIVHYAIDRNSSSRPAYSIVSGSETRGLSYVISAIGEGGRLYVRSSGGLVEIHTGPTGPEAKALDTVAACSVMGTQVYGVIRSRNLRTATSIVVEQDLPVRTIKSVGIGRIDGTANSFEDRVWIEEQIRSVYTHNESVGILDLGCTDVSPRSIESLVRNVVSIKNWRALLFWNVRTSWSTLVTLTSFTQDQPCVVLLVREWQDAIATGDSRDREALFGRVQQLLPWLGIRTHEIQLDALPRTLRLCFPQRVFSRIAREINTQYLETGFRDNANQSGFFVGKIHLLSGQTATRFFSFARNTIGSDANLQRWYRAADAAIRDMMHIGRQPLQELVLVAFSGTIRDLSALLATRLPASVRIYNLLTFDIPTREEMATIIGPSDSVVLLTDVVSSGSSTVLLGEMVTKVGAQLIGVVSLVDARSESNLETDTIQIGWQRVPFCSCAISTKTRDINGLSLVENEYWVDPVTLSPADTKPDSTAVTKELKDRIDYTMNALSATGSIDCGHITDGIRHTSVYLDLENLLRRSAVGLYHHWVNTVEDRLCWKHWRDFRPLVVVFPKGIARIERVDIGSGRSKRDSIVYATAVEAYLEYTRRYWPSCTELGVLRSFDPGGRSRCAPVSKPKEIEHDVSFDAVILDDGVWSGRTISSLLKIAVELGAARVLIAPLLSRLPLAELTHWESLSTLHVREDKPAVSVCFASPLVYPVTAYGYQDCPYDLTMRRLEIAKDSFPSLLRAASAAIEEIRGRRPGERENQSDRFKEVWLRARCLAELASDSEGHLEELRDLVRSIDDYLGLKAIFELALSEWQLFGRHRLRQSIQPVLREKGESIAEKRETEPDLRVLVASYLRSLHPVAFVSMIVNLYESLRGHFDYLERLLLHVATISVAASQLSPCIDFLQRFCQNNDLFAGDLDAEETRHRTEVFALARRLELHFRDEAKQIPRPPEQLSEKAGRLLDLIIQEYNVQHSVRPFLLRLSSSSDVLTAFPTNVWSSLLLDWEGKVEPILTGQFLPLIEDLRLSLERGSKQADQLTSPEVRYFVETTETGTRLANDISTIGFALRMLSQNATRRIQVEIVTGCAHRISSAILGSREQLKIAFDMDDGNQTYNISAGVSSVGRVLVVLRSTIVSALLLRLEERVAARLGSLDRLEVSNDIRCGSNISRSIFAAPDLLTKLIEHVTANLVMYAFPADSAGKAPAVRILLTKVVETEGSEFVRFTIMDNGHGAAAESDQQESRKRNAIEIDSHMMLFGGRYRAPYPALDDNWSFCQVFEVRVW